jgi:Ser/Thr protein kinase RdoA (MazF antagonist)
MRSGDRAKVEAAVAAHLRDVYELSGDLETVVHGANWTLRLCAAGQAIAYVRLCRRDRTLDDLDAEMALLNTIEATHVLNTVRPIASRSGLLVSTLTVPDGSPRYVTVFRPVGGKEPTNCESHYALIGAALAELYRQTILSALAPLRAPGPGAGTGSVQKIALH